jgi:hypothetical protein
LLLLQEILQNILPNCRSFFVYPDVRDPERKSNPSWLKAIDAVSVIFQIVARAKLEIQELHLMRNPSGGIYEQRVFLDHHRLSRRFLQSEAFTKPWSSVEALALNVELDEPDEINTILALLETAVNVEFMHIGLGGEENQYCDRIIHLLVSPIARRKGFLSLSLQDMKFTSALLNLLCVHFGDTLEMLALKGISLNEEDTWKVLIGAMAGYLPELLDLQLQDLLEDGETSQKIYFTRLMDPEMEKFAVGVIVDAVVDAKMRINGVRYTGWEMYRACRLLGATADAVPETRDEMMARLQSLRN